MASFLKPPFIEQFAFDTALDMTRGKPFAAFGKRFAGRKWTSWQRDEDCWNFRLGRYGGTQGKAFLRAIPSNLWASGATVEVSGVDALHRIASGSALSLLCEVSYAEDHDLDYLEFRLYNCASGAFVSQNQTYHEGSSTAAKFSGLANGSYIVWARCFDKTYASGDLRNAGEWSALKVRVGVGAWSVGAGVVPSPGCPLYVKNAADSLATITSSNEATYRVPFDPLARSVTAWIKTTVDIKLANGTVDVPAGSQIIAGLRASPGGGQSAVWLLGSDLTARLLALTTVFSNGQCECGKADHNASDLAQDAGGTLYMLSECSLHRYAPDMPTVQDRLPGEPQKSGGEPGGQCLRIYEGTLTFSTELLAAKPVGLGFYHYDDLLRRIGGKDTIGPGTIWHGPCGLALFQGKLWGFRSDAQDLSDPETNIVFDSIQNGVWSGRGVKRKATQEFYRQLQVRGNLLFWFGFAPGVSGASDTPLCSINDGLKIRLAQFPYFVQDATRCTAEDGSETLLVSCCNITEGRAQGNNGRSLRVVELPSAGTTPTGGAKVCSFWNAGAGEFRMTGSAFTAAGGDPAKLPLYLSWQAQSGSNGGGVWKAASTVPSTPYLALVGGSTIKYVLHGSMPYDPLLWGLLCFTIGPGGDVTGIGGGDPFEPSPTPTDAGQAFELMPDGTKWRVLERGAPDPSAPLSSIHIADLSDGDRLSLERDTYPCLWIRRDSSVPPESLASYKQLVKYSREQFTDAEALHGVDMVILVTPENQPIPAREFPALGRRK